MIVNNFRIENSKFPSAHAHITRNINGPNNRIHHLDTYDSLAAWENRNTTFSTNASWQALLGQWEGLIVPGSVENNFYRVIAER